MFEDKEFAAQLIEESAFTKVVYTKEGPALLIAGFVINVSASASIGVDVADVLSTALRRAGHGKGAITNARQGGVGAGAD